MSTNNHRIPPSEAITNELPKLSVLLNQIKNQRQQLTNNSNNLLQQKIRLCPASQLARFLNLNKQAKRRTKLVVPRMFSAMVLRAWRKRRQENNCLQNTIQNLEKEAMKMRNQLRVYISLIRVEHRRNDELTLKLDILLQNVREMEFVTRNRLQLQDELKQCKNDRKRERNMLDQLKKDLLLSLAKRKELQALLRKEQETQNEVEQQNLQLLQKIQKMRFKEVGYTHINEFLMHENKRKFNHIQMLQKELLRMRQRLIELEPTKNELIIYRKRETQRCIEMESNRTLLASLQAKLELSKKVLALLPDEMKNESLLLELTEQNLETDYHQVAARRQQEIELKTCTITAMKQEIQQLKQQLAKFEPEKEELRMLRERELKQRQEIDAMSIQIISLKTQLELSKPKATVLQSFSALAERRNYYWSTFNCVAFDILHVFLYYLLPGAPALIQYRSSYSRL